jgi:hypothetical protein
LSTSLCYRFTLEDRAWEIDFATLTLNDWILLQEVSGRTRKQLLNGIEEEDAVALKVLWWAARRGIGEDVALDSDEMNPQWADFSVRPVPHLTQPDASAPVAPKSTARPAPRKAPANKR